MQRQFVQSLMNGWTPNIEDHDVFSLEYIGDEDNYKYSSV